MSQLHRLRKQYCGFFYVFPSNKQIKKGERDKVNDITSPLGDVNQSGDMLLNTANMILISLVVGPAAGV